jgi:hypothetical protein
VWSPPLARSTLTATGSADRWKRRSVRARVRYGNFGGTRVVSASANVAVGIGPTTVVEFGMLLHRVKWIACEHCGLTIQDARTRSDLRCASCTTCNDDSDEREQGTDLTDHSLVYDLSDWHARSVPWVVARFTVPIALRCLLAGLFRLVLRRNVRGCRSPVCRTNDATHCCDGNRPLRCRESR